MNFEEEALLDEAPEYVEEPETLHEEEEPETEDEPTSSEPELRLEKTSDDLAALRAEAAAAKKEADEAKREAANEKRERQRAQYNHVQAHMEKLVNEDRIFSSHLRGLEVDLEEAKGSGDSDKIRAIRAAIDEKTDVRDNLKSEITKCTTYLQSNTPAEGTVADEAPKKETVEKATPTLAQIRANDFLEANKSWYHNPTHLRKRTFVNNLVQEWQESGYDASTAEFWNAINEKLKEFDGPPKQENRRTPPIVRGQVMDSQKPSQEKKTNTEALKYTNKILSDMGFTPRDKGTDKFEMKSKEVYKSVLNNLNKRNKRGVA